MNHPNRMLPIWLAGTLTFMMIMLSSKVCSAAAVDEQVVKLRQDWAIAKYETPRKQQDEVFVNLISRGEKIIQSQPNHAGAHLWLGTINATYASVKGGMGALKYAKAARTHLEKALFLDATVEQGLAHSIIGSLYARLPGWPVAFGDKKLAERHLLTAIQMDPKGRDSNYYYGDFLAEGGHKQGALDHLQRAKNAKLRKGYELQDKGRLREIEDSIAKVR